MNIIAQLKAENDSLLAEINALEAQLGSGRVHAAAAAASYSTSSAARPVDDAKVMQLVAELASKDAAIADLGERLNKNMMDYADLVSGALYWMSVIHTVGRKAQ